MDDVSSLVAQQYTSFSYPEPFPDIEAKLREGYYQIGDPSLFAPILWPEGRPIGPLRILVAGCGTVQASVLAYMNRQASVVGIDLSESSLAHQRFLQERHELSNLKLFNGDLRDVAKLGMQFDLIVSTGVLHHMKDPDEGLKALRGVLSDNGVMHLMVYGQVLRLGVYLLQDVFQRLQVKQDEQGIRLVKTVLSQLHKNHPVHLYASIADDLRHDSGLVDTFLHPQDRAYTVPEVIDFVERCGLQFQGWMDNAAYYPEGSIPLQSELFPAVTQVPVRDQWAIVEKLSASNGCHYFLAHHPDRKVPSPAEAFEDGSWMEWYPLHHPTLRIKQQPSFVPEKPAHFTRGKMEFELTPAEALLLVDAKGKFSAGVLLNHPAISAHPYDQRVIFGRKLYEKMWKLGHIIMSKVPSPIAEPEALFGRKP